MFRCVVNCKVKKVSEEKLSVEGKVTNYGASVRLFYNWELFERSSPDEEWNRVSDERFKTSTGRSSRSLSVSPRVIKPGMFCMLKFYSWISDGNWLKHDLI